MKLRLYRFLEMIFSYPAGYFGDLADSLDTELHECLRIKMQELKDRNLIDTKD